MTKPRPYKKELDYSFTFCAYPTIELCKHEPGKLRCIYLHPDFRELEALAQYCPADVPVIESERIFSRLGAGENAMVIGVFSKYACTLSQKQPHIVLVNPDDMGNLGTILRTAAAFSYRDIAVITPAADIFHPKTVRASMGAIFGMRFAHYESFEEYRDAFPAHAQYLFMLDAKSELSGALQPQSHRFSLVFGNERSGLPPELSRYGVPVRIRQSDQVDSLNLAAAVAVAAHTFAQNSGLRT